MMTYSRLKCQCWVRFGGNAFISAIPSGISRLDPEEVALSNSGTHSPYTPRERTPFRGAALGTCIYISGGTSIGVSDRLTVRCMLHIADARNALYTCIPRAWTPTYAVLNYFTARKARATNTSTANERAASIKIIRITIAVVPLVTRARPGSTGRARRSQPLEKISLLRSLRFPSFLAAGTAALVISKRLFRAMGKREFLFRPQGKTTGQMLRFPFAIAFVHGDSLAN